MLGHKLGELWELIHNDFGDPLGVIPLLSLDGAMNKDDDDENGVAR